MTILCSDLRTQISPCPAKHARAHFAPQLRLQYQTVLHLLAKARVHLLECHRGIGRRVDGGLLLEC